MTTFLAIILLAILLWLTPLYYQRWRRRYLRSRPLSTEQQQLLADNLPLYRLLTMAQQRELSANVALFLRDKVFVGCEGMQVTERMRVTVAAHACLLLLGRDNRCYPGLYTVLLYPGTYVVEEVHYDDHVETIGHSVREGEAHYRGPVVLSWSDLEEDLLHPHKGRNVALHEFAHKLDEEDGYYNGRPLFSEAGAGSNWATVFEAEFQELRRRLQPDEQQESGDSVSSAASEEPVLDLYGAESPAEFFAVATETFFVIPAAMRRAHPQLYRELCTFYRLDPARLPDNPDTNGTKLSH